MKVYIDTCGDSSVGIFGYTGIFELDWPDLDQPDERKRVRQIFHEAYSELCDEPASVTFGDECYTCYKLKNDCLCPVEWR